jgi:capsid protein
MSDKQRFSFSRAIDSLLRRNCLLDNEAIFDNEIRRRIESSETLHQLRASALPNTLSFYAPVLSRVRRDVSAGAGGAGVVAKEDIGPFSDLLQYSATIRQGAQLITNIQGDLSAGVSASLPAPSWVTETGAAPDTDQTFTKLDLKPKRVSAKIIVSSMLLSASPDAEALISGDLGKALSNQLDRAVLYGTGGVQPLGISTHPDTHKIAFDAAWWSPLTELEYQCALSDVSELFFGYIVSPIVRRELRRTMVSNGGTDPIWTELPNPICSNVVTGSEAFGGCWDSCVIASWALEVIVNPFSQAHLGKVEIVGHLFCDVGLRYPKAFGVIA